ncbi:MAG: TetR family transcriptional regulator [Methylococcaceae bacterium]|nr:TetR family transcriptional regulator [Methylococcaceae bacterium]
MATLRNPENTRLRILNAAFEEIHKHGFQGMRIDAVLKKTNLKKGALYHHFPSKQALGYAVFEEIIEKTIIELWINPLKNYDNPIEGFKAVFIEAGQSWDDEFFKQGCPLNNLSQEMTPIDEGFRQRIQAFFNLWRDAIANELSRGQQQGLIKKEIDVTEVARFIITASEGAHAQAKIAQNKQEYFSCGKQLAIYLDTLLA